MAGPTVIDAELHRYCTFVVAGQRFGLPVGIVREILRAQSTTPVPSADPVILGLINLRGEIVTLVDLRCRLGLPPAGSSAVRSESGQAMHVVVRIGDEIVSLSVDAVGEVVELRPDRFEEPPPTVAAPARDMIVAVCQVDDGLVQILDVATLLPAVDSAD